MAGFVLTLLYLVLLFVRLEDLLPALAPYSPMLVLGGLSVIASVPSVQEAQPFKRREFQLLLLFVCVMLLSDFLGLWFGGGLEALRRFSAHLVDAIGEFRTITVDVHTRAWQDKV